MNLVPEGPIEHQVLVGAPGKILALLLQRTSELFQNLRSIIFFCLKEKILKHFAEFLFWMKRMSF
jgi:hypothetical protein